MNPLDATNAPRTPTSESTAADDEARAVLRSVVREEFGRVAYSGKTHFKVIDRVNRWRVWLKVANAVLLTVTAGGTVDVLVRDQTASKILTLLLSAAALGLAIYSLSMNYDGVVDQHRVAARALWLLREQYVHLIGDLKSGVISVADGRARRDWLTTETARIYELAPETDAKAYRAAQQALKVDEELTFSDDELDVLLPTALREAPRRAGSASSPGNRP